MEEQGTWASQKHSEAGYGRPVDRGVWTAKTVKQPWQQSAHPQYANYWAPLTRKRHTMPHSAQPQHTNYWDLRTRKRHQQEHRPQRPTESSDPTQHAKGRTGDRPGPRKGATTRQNAECHTGGGLDRCISCVVPDCLLHGGVHLFFRGGGLRRNLVPCFLMPWGLLRSWCIPSASGEQLMGPLSQQCLGTSLHTFAVTWVPQ